MKKVIVLLILIGLLYTAAYAVEEIYHKTRLAQTVDPGQLHTAKDTWVSIDTTTSSGTEPTDLATNERTYAQVAAAIAAAASGDDEISIYGDSMSEKQIMESWNIARFRCIGLTNDQTIIYQIYLGTLGTGSDCNLAKAGQLSFVIGTQSSTTTSYEMADAVTATAADWVKSWSTRSPSGNQVCEAAIDLMGADLIIAVCTSATCNTQLLAKGY